MNEDWWGTVAVLLGMLLGATVAWVAWVLYGWAERRRQARCEHWFPRGSDECAFCEYRRQDKPVQ